MTQNIQSNGYGSFKQKIVVKVDTEHAEAFSDAFGVEPFRVLEGCSDFIVNALTRYRGDDETVLYEIDYSLPVGVPRSAWSVQWGESTY